jgi:hypothetical protein
MDFFSSDEERQRPPLVQDYLVMILILAIHSAWHDLIGMCRLRETRSRVNLNFLLQSIYDGIRKKLFTSEDLHSGLDLNLNNRSNNSLSEVLYRYLECDDVLAVIGCTSVNVSGNMKVALSNMMESSTITLRTMATELAANRTLGLLDKIDQYQKILHAYIILLQYDQDQNSLFSRLPHELLAKIIPYLIEDIASSYMKNLSALPLQQLPRLLPPQRQEVYSFDQPLDLKFLSTYQNNRKQYLHNQTIHLLDHKSKLMTWYADRLKDAAIEQTQNEVGDRETARLLHLL